MWLSERQHDKRQFAVKQLTSTNAADIERFQREVRCLSQLDHPNIVRVVAKSLSFAPYWYAMPPYERSLFEEIEGGDIVSNHQRIYTVFRSILDAIRFAHKQKVIHRDLKPENVLMNSDNDVVVSDFGLGRILDTASTRRTQTGEKMGSVFYCAPEQLLDSKRADIRSDIFSLGRMLYELYTGPLTTAVQDMTSVPSSAAMIIERATLRDPDRRYQSTDRMLEKIFKLRWIFYLASRNWRK